MIFLPHAIRPGCRVPSTGQGAWTNRSSLVVLGLCAAAALVPSLVTGETAAPPTAECCKHPDLAEQYGIIWTGLEPRMPIERLAAYAAPVIWFSPDEPLLKIGQTGGRMARGKEIRIPEPFPFEDDPGAPVVYYRMRWEPIYEVTQIKGDGETLPLLALRDPDGANLDRVQIVKGWLETDGSLEEMVYDVVWSGGRKPGPGGKLPPVGNTVQGARNTNSIGSALLMGYWKDPDFDPSERAGPTPRPSGTRRDPAPTLPMNSCLPAASPSRPSSRGSSTP